LFLDNSAIFYEKENGFGLNVYFEKGEMIMSARVLQINVKFEGPGADLKKGFAHAVNDIAAVPGLRWKIWIMNEQTHEAGGLYQ
jgi:hypothetical protein